MTPVLDVGNLSVRIRTADGGYVHAVDDVSCQVEAGEIVSVVGESGCGKTMLAMSILGLLPSGAEITSGEVRLDGEDLRHASAARLRSVRGSRIGTIFQEPMSALNPVLTVGDQIGEVLRRHESLDRPTTRRRVVELLDLVGVAEAGRRAGQYPHELSGGMAQRAVIAMAIACRPRLLLADEPTTALDVTIQAAVLRVLDDLRRQMDMGVLLITHDLGVVADAADRVLVMYAGRVVERAGVNDLFAAPQHPYTLGLLGAARHPARTRPRSRLAEIPGIVPTMRARATDCSFAPRCPRADGVCRSVRPELASSDGALDHAVACFHPGRR